MSENRQHNGPPPGGGPGGHGGDDAYKDSTGGYSPHGGYGGHGEPYGGYGGHGSGHGAGGSPPGGGPYPGGPYPGGPYPGASYAGGPRQEEQGSQAGAITALVVSLVLVMTCCGFLGIVGTVFSARALSERADPERYQRYTRIAWVSNGVILGLLALFLTFIVVAVVSGM